MNRRGFFGLLAALPCFRWLKPKPKSLTPWGDFLKDGYIHGSCSGKRLPPDIVWSAYAFARSADESANPEMTEPSVFGGGLWSNVSTSTVDIYRVAKK